MNRKAYIAVSVTCPCGGTASIGQDDSGEYCVLHTLPMCDHYEKLDALAYVKWLRLTAEGKGLDS